MNIEYPRFGAIVVEGTQYDHDVVIENGRVRARDKRPSKNLKSRYGHTPLSAGEDLPWHPPRLLIGTGYSGRLPIFGDVRDEAEQSGIELLALPTADASALLGDMDPLDVNAVLHITC